MLKRGLNRSPSTKLYFVSFPPKVVFQIKMGGKISWKTFPNFDVKNKIIKKSENEFDQYLSYSVKNSQTRYAFYTRIIRLYEYFCPSKL